MKVEQENDLQYVVRMSKLCKAIGIHPGAMRWFAKHAHKTEKGIIMKHINAMVAELKTFLEKNH